MRYLVCIGLLFVVMYGLGAQPGIQWQKNLGGNLSDEGTKILQTDDGGFILSGRSYSNNGDVSGNHGAADYWILKLTFDGILDWQKSFGGSGNERCNAISLTSDDGYILAGQASSNNGQVSGNHGDIDCWIVKLDKFGVLEWQRCYGGSNWDEASSVVQTNDGGYAFAGRVSSGDGDVFGYHGAFDFWVVKINSSGEIEWQKPIGGTGVDICYSIKQTLDGGYIVNGESNSNDGDASGLIGSSDYWVVKLSSSGEIEWQKMLGSSSLDRGNDIVQLPTGEYLAFGHISWGDGNVTLAYNGYDYWVAKLSNTGEIIWQHTYGGTGEDFSSQINLTKDGGFIMVGSTNSKDGDITDNNGGVEYLIMKADSLGQLQWQKTLGGTMADRAFGGIQTADEGFILTGYSWSNNGDVGGNKGENDFWIVKLAPETSTTSTPTIIPLNLYPNPASHWITLNLPIIEQDMQVNTTDDQGKLIQSRIIRTDEKLDISAHPPGIYWVSAVSKSGQVYAGKFVKN
ncbi:MAG: T9SS type A sorting domain-containing protein [Chitinophagales bacterium]|nr:T9SS type A sorting domain-containing protein [Chitinophagales bacterium]